MRLAGRTSLDRSEELSKILLARVVAGDASASTELVDRYTARLLAAVRSRLSPKLRRRLDEEDVVQSAYRSFFVHAMEGDFYLKRSGDLWRLLVAIALNKLNKQVERHTAARRAIGVEEPTNLALENLYERQPTPQEEVALQEQFEQVLQQASPIERMVLEGRLRGEEIDAIAKESKRSPRTLRRILHTLEQRFIQELLDLAPTEIEAFRSVTPQKQALKRPVKTLVPSSQEFRFDDLVLHRLLGSGGMGKVYYATIKSTGAVVAVKALRKDRQRDQRSVNQFLHEAQILSDLRIPGIVGLQGRGRFPGGGHFLVLDYIAGEDLQSQLREQVLPPLTAARIAQSIATIVQSAHDRGVIHCDLKPSNILIENGATVWITDFGFARLLQAPGQQANAAEYGGTLAYMAPEQLFASVGPIGPGTDVYGIGSILHSILYGRPPRRQDRDFVELAAQTDPAVPEVLAKICARCLEHKPQDRYATAKDVADALASFLAS